MKKYRNYIIITIVLIVVALVLFIKDRPGTLKVDRDYFAIRDTAAVTVIRISSGNEAVVLSRGASGWMVNGSYVARPQSVRAIFNQLVNLQISSPVAKSQKTKAIQKFEHSVSIEVEASGKVITSFRMAEGDGVVSATLAMMTGDSEPYEIGLPGFTGPISKLFPARYSVWMDKTLLRYSPAEIAEVSINYPTNTSASFVYRFNSPTNIEISNSKGDKKVLIDKETARNYLMNFASVSFESLVTKSSKVKTDSLRRISSLCEIQILRPSKEKFLLKLYRVVNQNDKSKHDINRMYAVAQDDTLLFVVKYVDFDPIMKEFKDFSRP